MRSSQRLSFLRCLGLAILLCICAFSAFATTSAPIKVLTSVKNIIVWQRFGQWLVITEDLTNGRVCYFYDPVVKSKMTVKEALPGSWIPLGSAIKWLMYVDHYNGIDRLMAHDVDWHYYYIAWNSAQDQVGCGMINTQCIFGQYRSAKIGDYYPVDLYNFNVETGACVSFCISDSNKSQFAHDGNLMVYRSYSGPGTARITGHYFSGGDEFTIASRDGIEPSVDGSLVAWAEVSGSGYNIVAKNTQTGEIRTIAYTTSNPPNPEVGKGNVFWRDSRNASTTGIDIYGYDWQSRQEYIVTNVAGDQLKLRVCGDFVTWVTGLINNQILWYSKIITPVQITDLRPTLVTNNSAQLSWTSVGSSSNPAISYELRTRADAPITDSNWASSSLITGLSTPKTAGLAEQFNVNNLSTGHHYFAIKAKLRDNTYSLLSNCVVAYVSHTKAALSADFGAYVSVSGIVTGLSNDGSFYCETGKNGWCIRVIPASGQNSIAAGQYVTATGKLAQSDTFAGPVLDAAVMTGLLGANQITCVAMPNWALGGYDPKFGGTGKGASNIWRRVKSWGRVSGLVLGNGCSFYMNDGSAVNDNNGKGIYVNAYLPPTNLANGSYVCVEGISKVSRLLGRQIEVVDPNGVVIVSN